MQQTRKFILEQFASKNISRELAKVLLSEIGDKKSEDDNSIAIIGIYGKMPGANSLDELWNNMAQGRSSITDYPEERRKDTDAMLTDPHISKRMGFDKAVRTEDLNKMYKKAGYLNEIDKFDAAFFNIPPKEAELMDPHHRLFLETAYGAIEDAGYGGKKIYGTATGVFVGRDHTTETYYSKIINNREMLTLIGSWTGLLASRVSYFLNLKGPSIVVDTACSSSLAAVHMACQALKNNECEMALAGGITVGSGRIKTDSGMDMVESEDDLVRTFDKKANGTVWSEGTGVVLLKPLSRAVEDMDNIYAVIKGSAINNDGASNGITAPSVEAQEELLVKAWKDAGISPDTISYIEAHGTGTNLGDPIEIKALSNAFKKYTDKKQFCAIGTIKTNMGHLQAASGIASILKVVLALKNSFLPPSINFFHPNPYINFLDSPVFVNDVLREWKSESTNPRRAGISSFGFSGTNCHTVLEEYTKPFDGFDNSRTADFNVLTLSAKSEEALKQLIKSYKQYLSNENIPNIQNICYTANTGRGHYKYRAAVIASDMRELIKKINILECDLAQKNSDFFFAGRHSIAINKEVANGEQITEAEKREITEDANKVINLFLDGNKELKELLEEICRLYIRGADIQWEKLYGKEKIQKVSLPVYPFERNRFWAKSEDCSKNENNTDMFFKLGWIEQSATTQQVSNRNGSILVFNGENSFGQKLCTVLRNQELEVIEVSIASEYEVNSRQLYTIKNTFEDYRKLFVELKDRNITNIIHLMTDTNVGTVSDLDGLKQSQRLGVYSLLYMAKAIQECGLKEKLDILLLSKNVKEVTGLEKQLNPSAGSLFGIGKVINSEYSNISCKCMDIDEYTSPERIAAESLYGKGAYLAAYRGDKRYVEELRKVNVDTATARNFKIKNGGVYIITGGTGGIGLATAKYLSSRENVKLILVNRSKLPEREQWNNIIEEGKDILINRKLQELMEIEKTGSEVECYSADVCKPEEVSSMLDTVRSKYGKINGLIHSAGVAGKGFIVNSSDEAFNSVLEPKVIGTWLLDEMTRNDDLDFFMLFSSVMSILGGSGQADYVAANSYMDAFADYRQKTGRKTILINWPAWSETGMALNHGFASQEGVFKPISNENAVSCFDTIFNKEIDKVIVGEINAEAVNLRQIENLGLFVSNEIRSIIDVSKIIKEDEYKTKKFDTHVKLTGRNSGNYTEAERKVARVWNEVLGFEEMDINSSLFDIGGDSIMVGKIHSMMEELFPGKTAVTDIFSNPTIAMLAGLVEKSEHAKVKKEIELLSLPEEYFAEVTDSNNISQFKVELGGAEFQKLLLLSQRESTEINDILLSLYINLLAEVAGQEKLTVQSYVGNTAAASSLSVNLTQIKDISQLFQTVKQAKQDIEEKSIYGIQEIDKFIHKKDRVSVLPLFCDDSFLVSKSAFLNSYDIILSTKKEREMLLLKYKFNSKRLNQNKMKELFSRYLKYVKAVCK